MFVLTHTAEVLREEGSVDYTILLLVGLCVIVGIFIAEGIKYRRWKKELDKKYPNSRK